MDSNITVGQIRDIVAQDWGYADDYAVRRRIELAIIPARATIIQRRYDSTKVFPEALLQTIRIKDFVTESHFNITFRRSKFKVPKPIIVRNDSYFVYVGDRSYARAYDYEKQWEVQFRNKRRFTSNRPYYFYADDYMFFGNVNNIEEILARAVFDNPFEAKQFGTCKEDEYCFDDVGDLIIEQSLFDPIISLLNERQPRVINPEQDKEVNV